MKNNGHLVTVGIPAYNHEKYIEECIKSVIMQSHNNIELIIINDGSQDETHNVILQSVERCKERFVRFEYRNRKNIGLTATLNEMLEWSEGTYFSVIASDDILDRIKVELLVEVLEQEGTECAAAFGNVKFIDSNSDIVNLDEDGKRVNVNTENSFQTFMGFLNKGFDKLNRSINYEEVLKGLYIPAAGVVFRSYVLKQLGGWTSGNTVEDLEMWFKILKQNQLLYVDKIVAYYRLHDNNSISTIPDKMRFDICKILIQEKKYAISNGLKSIHQKSVYKQLYNSTVSYLFEAKYKKLNEFILYLLHLDSIFILKMLPKLFYELSKRCFSYFFKKMRPVS